MNNIKDKIQTTNDKEREKRARKIRSKNYTVDGDGNIVKVKKTKEDPKKHAKHMEAIKKGYFLVILNMMNVVTVMVVNMIVLIPLELAAVVDVQMMMH